MKDKSREEIISLIEKDEVILDAMVDLSYNSINFIQSNKNLNSISTQDAELIFDKAISVRYKDKVSSLRAEDPDREDPEEFDYLMKAVGIDVLVSAGITKYGVKQLSKSAIKTLLKRAVPYIGLAVAVYEFGDCIGWW